MAYYLRLGSYHTYPTPATRSYSIVYIIYLVPTFTGSALKYCATILMYIFSYQHFSASMSDFLDLQCQFLAIFRRSGTLNPRKDVILLRTMTYPHEKSARSPMLGNCSTKLVKEPTLQFRRPIVCLLQADLLVDNKSYRAS